MIDLKPCPFCGTRVALGSNPDDGSNAGWRIVHPRNGCYIGECDAPSYMPRDALVEKWNRRASPHPSCDTPGQTSGVQNVGEMPLTKAQIRDMERRRICSILKEQGFDVEDRAILPFGAV